MGRQKRPFPLGRFRLRYPKNYDKCKAYPIEIIYIFGGRTLRRNMNISVAIADWNPNGNNGRGEIRASNHSLTPILKGCEAACKMGLIDQEINALLQDMRIQEKASLEAEGEKEFDGHNLSKEQLAQLVEFYNNDKEPRRKEFIEMFLFAFHACGLRIVDVMTLQWSHIDFEKKELSKVLIKTSKRHKIPLTAPALRILYKWQAMGRRKKYVFDLVKDDLSLDDADSLYRARNSATKCVNQSLHVVGEKLGFSFPLSFHTARHTFAVLAINDGLTMTVVSRLLGHSSTDITEKVYARPLPQTLTAEVEKLNYQFVPDELSN